MGGRSDISFTSAAKVVNGSAAGKRSNMAFCHYGDHCYEL